MGRLKMQPLQCKSRDARQLLCSATAAPGQRGRLVRFIRTCLIFRLARLALPQDLIVESTPALAVTPVDASVARKLAEHVGWLEGPDELPALIGRLGHVQRWVLERLAVAADEESWPPWVPITRLAADYVGGGLANQRQVASIRHACHRLAKLGLIETAGRWIEREEARSPLRMRREERVRRRHLCVRLPTTAAERARSAATQDRTVRAYRQGPGDVRGRERRAREW